MSKSGKPRTVTGRVARHLHDAVIGVIRARGEDLDAWREPTLEWLFMAVAHQLSHQGLEPADFDNEYGKDALGAVFLTLTSALDVARVTPDWRRVVVAARYRAHTLARDAARRMRTSS